MSANMTQMMQAMIQQRMMQGGGQLAGLSGGMQRPQLGGLGNGPVQGGNFGSLAPNPNPAGGYGSMGGVLGNPFGGPSQHPVMAMPSANPYGGGMGMAGIGPKGSPGMMDPRTAGQPQLGSQPNQAPSQMAPGMNTGNSPGMVDPNAGPVLQRAQTPNANPYQRTPGIQQ